jgi:hypothetical protein
VLDIKINLLIELNMFFKERLKELTGKNFRTGGAVGHFAISKGCGDGWTGTVPAGNASQNRTIVHNNRARSNFGQ